jgi:hypothetical protein
LLKNKIFISYNLTRKTIVLIKETISKTKIKQQGIQTSYALLKFFNLKYFIYLNKIYKIMGNTTLSNNSKKEIKSLYNLIEYEEYFLIKENNVFKFIIEKEYNNIIIKCQNYEKHININDLSILNKSLFKNIDDAYEYINNLFENNKVNIKDIHINFLNFINYFVCLIKI